YLSDADEAALKDLQGIIPDTELPANLIGDPKDINAVQALKLCMTRLKDQNTSGAKKAVYLCWVLHLVADIHQPLHAPSLYSKGRFNQLGGDHGGNSIHVKQGGKLHSFWDGLLGRNITFNNVQKRSHDIASDDELRQAGEKAAQSLKPEVWVQ